VTDLLVCAKASDSGELTRIEATARNADRFTRLLIVFNI
jgi:hypothetical protein